jgi:predicted RNA binding protein YcfA (HicA-like mRNA interferase family)
MSPKLPVVSRRQLIRALQKFGSVEVRQKGSHVRRRNAADPQRQSVTIPLHDEIASGTLRHVLRDVRVTMEELISAL